MAAVFDQALRENVVGYYIDNHSLDECAICFGISKTTAALYVRKANKTRSVADRMELRGVNNPNGLRWKGGASLRCKPGYMSVYIGHKNGTSFYRSEHVLIAEKALGRPLKRGEIIHHINGNGLDNRNCNLLICSRSYHFWFHQKMARLYQEEHFNGGNTK